MRIFIGLTEISGYYGRLRRGLRAHGVPSLMLNLVPHGYGPDSDGDFLLEPLARRLVTLELAAGPLRYAVRLVRLALEWPLRLWALCWALLRCDVFVFGYFSTFFWYWELPILRLFGKRIVYIFHGSDSRPAYMDGSFAASLSGAALARMVRRQKAAMRRVERYATHLVNHPPTAQLHERPFVQWLWLGIPTPQPEPALDEARRPGAVRIVHAPSVRALKGSDEIAAIIERIKASGVEVDYRELHGVPFAEVWRVLKDSDFVIDQLWSDTPMAGFVAEAAVVGSPAVVGSYAAREVDRLVAPDVRPPSVFAEPAEVEAAVARLIQEPEQRRELGRRAQAYVRDRWTAAGVAGRLLELLAGGDAPLVDPGEVRYPLGLGVTPETLGAAVAAVVAAAGEQALQVGDKPELQAALLAAAATAEADGNGAAPPPTPRA